METVKKVVLRAVKLWWQLDKLGCAALLILIGGIIVSWVGIPKTFEENVEAQRCIVAVPAADRNSTKALLEEPIPMEYIGAEFAWFLEEAGECQTRTATNG